MITKSYNDIAYHLKKINIMTLKSNPKPITRNIGTKIAEREYNKINRLIESGIYISNSDFLRDAICDKLRAIEEIEERDISRTQAKKEIYEFCKKNNNVMLSDIAECLKIDIFLDIYLHNKQI